MLPSLTDQPQQFRKPRADLYTVLLILSLLALIVGCVFMYLEVQDYGEEPYKGAPSVALPLDQQAEPALAFNAAIGLRADTGSRSISKIGSACRG